MIFNQVAPGSTFENDSSTKTLTAQEGVAAQIDQLKTLLQKNSEEITEFNKKKSAATEKLRNAEKFDKDFSFSDEILKAAACCKLYDAKTYSDFKASIQNYITLSKTEKFLQEWKNAVKNIAANIENYRQKLIKSRNEIQAKVNSLSFVADNEEFEGFIIPEGYGVDENGILKKFDGNKFVEVCLSPVGIQSKIISKIDGTEKFSLRYKIGNKWKSTPPQPASTLFNSRKIVDLADYGLPVSSANALLLSQYLNAFKVVNAEILPESYSVSRPGWHDFFGKDYFIDPRRNCTVTADSKNYNVVVDSTSIFAGNLKTAGSLYEWKKAYDIAKESPVARLIVAASVAPPLLKILGVRNFLLYIYAPTTAGKTTATCLAASAVGSEKIIRSFDGTANGLAGAAADVNDYPFLLDEKQVADKRLKEQFSRLAYSLANGIGRTKLNKDSTLKKLQDWRTVAVMTGETPLFADNVTGGANTRCLSIAAPNVILATDSSQKIWDIIKVNYGHAFTLVIDQIFKHNFFNLNEVYNSIYKYFLAFPNVSDEYRRYMAVMTTADILLNIALGVNQNQAYSDAFTNAEKIFLLIPTLDEISDTPREKDFVTGFIAQNQRYFLGATPGNSDIDRLPYIYGKFEDDFVYITATALKQACEGGQFDFRKLVADLIVDGFFIPADTIPKGRSKPEPSVPHKIGSTCARCYRIPLEKISPSK